MPKALRTLLQTILATALVALIMLPGLGGAGLLDPWEMDRAAVARSMAGARQIVTTLPAKEAAALGVALGDGFAVRAIEGGLPRLTGELAGAIVHGVVVQVADGLHRDERAAMLDARVQELDAVLADNPGAAVLLVGDEPAAEVAGRLGRARARAFARSLGASAIRFALPGPGKIEGYAPLFTAAPPVVRRDALAAALRAATPSPWTMPLHRKERAAAPAPVLDTWLVALSLSTLGPSEAAARLPGALLLLLAAASLFVAMRALHGALAAWLAVAVLATLPLAVGGARVLTLEGSTTLGLLWAAIAVAALSGPASALATSASAARASALRGALALAGLATALLLLLLARGLGGVAMGAALAVVVAIVRGREIRPWLGAGLSVALLALAAFVVLGDESSPLLRALRFTRVPFSAGLGADNRDFSVLIGQVGFGLHPWGGLFLLGAGRLLFPPASDDAGDTGAAGDGRHGVVWLVAFAAALLTTALLLPKFAHVFVPVAPLAAAVTALLLRDVLQGRVHGPLLALFAVIAVLLLHRETGKDAGTLVRFFAWDPPFGGEHAAYTWPEELKMPRIARALGLLGVVACALTMARPVAALRRLLDAVQPLRRAGWLAAGALVVWALDALISLGVRLDVLLRAEASRTGYNYDRVWVTIQSVRPEVIAGAVVFALALLGVALQQAAPARLPRLRRLLDRLSPLTRPKVALALLAAAAAAVAVSGVMVHGAVANAGVGAALAASAGSPWLWLPLALLLPTAALRLWAMRSGGDGPGLAALAALGLLALAGVGVGASAAVGTWSYGYLLAVWGLGAAGLALAAGGGAAALARFALAAAALTAAGLFVVLARRFAEVQDDAVAALVKTLVAAPDTALLLAIALLALLNHAATRQPRLAGARTAALFFAGLGDKPAFGVAAASVGAVVLASGYAFGLLPSMSVHFSQKHLLAAIEAAGGAPVVVDGEQRPRAFKHPGTAGARVLGSNFYTASLPTLASRDQALAVLAGEPVEAAVSDWGPSARTATVPVPEGPRFVVLPKAEFSAFNHAFRGKHEGRSVPVLDASSSRLVLTASELPAGRKSENWIDGAVLSRAQFDALTGVTAMRADFDGKLELIGWRLAEQSVRRSQKYHLELFFDVKVALEHSLKLFMHPHPLHRDLWPLAVAPDTEAEEKRCTGCFQTNHWRVGDIIRVDIDQEVPLGTSAGPQDIILGWYDPLNDNRLPLGTVTGPGTERHGDNRVTIGRLLVR